MKIYNRGPRPQAIKTKTGVVVVPAGGEEEIKAGEALKPSDAQLRSYKDNNCFFTKEEALAFDGKARDLANEAKENAKLAGEAKDALAEAKKAKEEAAKSLGEAEQAKKDAEALSAKTAEEKAEIEKLVAEIKAEKVDDDPEDAEKAKETAKPGQQSTKTGTDAATK